MVNPIKMDVKMGIGSLHKCFGFMILRVPIKPSYIGSHVSNYRDGEHGTNKHITITHYQWEPMPIFTNILNGFLSWDTPHQRKAPGLQPSG